MIKKKALILDFENFGENKIIIILLNEDNLIKKTLLKNYKAKINIVQIGNLIEYKFFGRENSLGFVDISSLIPFGNFSIDKPLNLKCIYCICFLMNKIHKENIVLENLFQESLNFFYILKKDVYLSKKEITESYFKLETMIIFMSGFFIDKKQNKYIIHERNNFLDLRFIEEKCNFKFNNIFKLNREFISKIR